MMKNWIFVILILGFSLYTLLAAFFGWNSDYGVYGLLLSMIAELAYDKWELKKLRSKSNVDKT
jgi:hypothetical protein